MRKTDKGFASQVLQQLERHAALDEAMRKHQHYTFPTLTLRQAHILLECMRMGMGQTLHVEGQYVSADEWMALIKTLVDVRK